MTDLRRESSFDALAKGLASGTVSRRQALRLMGAALVGGTLASVPGMAWAAKPTCPSGVTCRGQCCPVGATCTKGAGGGCTCPAGQPATCGGQCVALNTAQNCGSCGNVVDTQTDEANCGSCGKACSTGQSCVSGACVTPCDRGAVGDFCLVSLGCCSGKCRWIYDTSQPCLDRGQCECVA